MCKKPEQKPGTGVAVGGRGLVEFVKIGFTVAGAIAAQCEERRASPRAEFTTRI